MKITLLLITDGRADCLVRTIDSFRQMAIGEIAHKVLIDDSCNADFGVWLRRHLNNFQIVHNDRKQGFCGAIQTGWNNVPDDSDAVFHLEDDFVFKRRVDLKAMFGVLRHNRHLAQMALRRQPWNESEIKAGGIVEQWPNEYEEISEGGNSWLEHELFFTSNPSVYLSDIMFYPWPDPPDCEQRFTERLKDAGYRFAFWGKRSDAPWVEHIGKERVGCGY